MRRLAVVLFNLGGPDSPKAVGPFLYNLFRDPAIIRLPAPFRQIIARLIAAERRPDAQRIYAQIGGRSPIFENTNAQAKALEAALIEFGEIKCFIAMRYWHPFAEGTARAVKDFAPDEIVLLPLYPQFSTTTTASSLTAWGKAAKAAGLNVPVKTIYCYPNEPGFIRALASSTHKAYTEAQKFGSPRVLFSAHGLPEKIVKAGDPYQRQCEETVAALVHALGIGALDYVLCYQSRIGPLRWIGPATEEEVRRAGCEKRPLVVVPVAFVSEHSETLVELDILYRNLALASGVPYFVRVPAVGAAPEFIEGLANLVQAAARGTNGAPSFVAEPRVRR